MPEAQDRLSEGFALHQQGRLDEARAIYETVLAGHPGYFGALYLLGVLKLESKEIQPAADLLAQAVAVNPGHAEARYHYAVALKSLGRLDAAIAGYQHAINLKPDFAQAYMSRAAVFADLNRFEDAVAHYDKAIALTSCSAAVYLNRGNALAALERFEDAVASFDEAIARNANHAATHYNRGNALRLLKRSEEALDSYDRAIELKPEYVVAYSNRGNALQDLKRFDEAFDSYDRALAVDPEHAEAHWNKALALLMLGDFERGWPLYEWRWKDEASKRRLRAFQQPLWLGDQLLQGKTILLHSEQGLGDSIQFSRYATLVAAQGARVILEVPPTLAGVMRRLDGVDTVVTGTPHPAFDLQCPLLSLPLALKAGVNDIPGAQGYLRSDAAKRAAWSTVLGPKTKPRVGLVWSASATNIDRSVPLAMLIAALPDTHDYVSLQKDVPAQDKTTLTASAVKHIGGDIGDFEDTAALCDLMDVVISVDTSVAHISGAIGKPTWIMLPYIADWRWFLNRNDSPWYGSVKLYRQECDIRWEPVLERIRHDLIAAPSRT
jgi:tetratricopeptide (TPR) repeat protein